MRLLALAAVVLTAPALAQTDESVRPPNSITGVVTDAETGLPLVGAGVMIAALERGTITDRAGRFVIEDVPSGTHDVRAGAYTYHFATLTVDIEEGQGAAVEASLRPGAGVGCEVLHSHDEAGGLHHVDG